ncbi:MAG: MFS transporter [Chloroflexi bacterium]|nr:MFS transporter [Chloroflexota bacterium]
MHDTIVTTGARRRLIWTLFVGQSLIGAGMFAAVTLMSIAAVELSGSASAAGLPSTSLLIGRAISAYPVGWLMSRYGRRPGLVLGYALAVLGFVFGAATLIMQSFIGFCLAAALIGMGRAVSDQSRYAAADVEVPERKAKAISTVVLAGVVGAIIGPLLVAPSGEFVERRGFDAFIGPYVVGAVLSLLALLLTEFLLRPDPMSIARTIGSDTTDQKQNDIGRSVREILKLRYVQVAVAALVIGQLVMTLIMVITPLHMDDHAHSFQSISLVIMAHTIGMFAPSALTGRLVNRFGAYLIILVGALILAISAILAPLSNEMLPLAFALFLLGLGWNFCFIAGSSLLTVGLVTGEEGRIQGASEVLVALASGAGSLSTGAIFAGGGMTGVSMVGLALTLAFGVLAVLANQRRGLEQSLVEHQG